MEKVTVHGQGGDYGGHSLQAVGGESRKYEFQWGEMAGDKDDLIVVENFETVILHRPAIGAAAEAEQEENNRLLLDVVVMECAVVL